ncbi:BT_3987 domain-containing protein [Bacteroides cellulosilyticus]|uniref:BT_3987 domain-containing protein n=1 Tax=Bacteroides cellulosilyticus TaxID=246787 RepID=UPI0035616816
MKKNLIIHFILLLLTVGMTGCTEESISMNAARLPDETVMENTAGILRSMNTLTNKIFVGLTEGDQSATEEIYYLLSQPTKAELTVKAIADEKLVEDYNKAYGTKLAALPVGNVQFEEEGTLSIAAGKQESASIRFTISTVGLDYDTPYLLPLTIEQTSQSVQMQNTKNTLYYAVNIRKKITTCNPFGPYEQIDIPPMLPNALVVFYVNTSTYQPLIADIYGIRKINQTDYTETLYNIGSIVNLRTVTVDYEKISGRALLSLSSDIRDVLEQAGKFIRPLQEHGRKVCICIEGGGKGLGFCNLTDSQIADFTQQVKDVINLYKLDGVNLRDEGSAYGKDGMPATNTTSYPKLIKALRDALPGKLLTLVDRDEPTEYFYDVDQCGGIEVGKFIDYAWHTYDNGKELVQIIEPWETDHPYSEYTRKPIAGLTPEHYGSLTVPLYEKGEDKSQLRNDSRRRVINWKMDKRKKNNLIIYAFDLTSNEQNNYEGMVTNFALGYINAMMDDGDYWGKLPSSSEWGIISGDYSYHYSPLDWVLEAMYNVYSKGWVHPTRM